ncbi:MULTISPECIES: ABC transporter [unclassified Enterococcus]|uniref:ABC transporter n=1 Tax=unclassified Enterococcus TaxID=2608891 RepID=UPI0013EACDAB|nr:MULTISPECIES: ABC transporter [unclassified Enterococcus]
MVKGQLIELTRVNLRYANPQLTNKAREKGKSGKELSSYLLRQYVLSAMIFLLIYGFTMFMVDFSRMPGFFTYYMALFGILGLSQSVTIIYNVFFEGNDLQTFLPLPFRQGQIFLAKIAVVALTVAPYVLPLIVVFILTGWRSGLLLPFVILFSFLLFCLCLVLIFCLSSLIVFGLARTAFFQKHKKLVTSLLLGGSMLVAIFGILLMNNQTSTFEKGYTDHEVISLFIPFYYAISQPFTQIGVLSWLGVMMVAAGLAGGIKIGILPKLYDQLTTAMSGTEAKRKHKKNQNLKQLLWSYHSQLVRDPNLIMQVLSSSLLTPIIFVFAFAFTGEIDLSSIDIRLIGVVFLAGVSFAFLTVNQTSFVSNMISLDRENFLFIRSLPLSMKKYLKEKFRFACCLQMFLTGGIALVSGVIFRMPLLFLFILVLGSILGSYLLSMRFFARDYRMLQLEWTNINQLFTRGSGALGLVAAMIGTIIGSVILLVLYGIAAFIFPFWLLNGVVWFLILGCSALWVWHYKRVFWSRFD